MTKSALLILTLATVDCCMAAGAESVNALELSSHIRQNFLGRTNGSTQVFSKNVGGTVYARNPNFWLRGLDGLTGIHSGGGPGATAITRWHILGANHWKHDAGSKLYFCDLNDHTVSRSVVAGTEISSDIKSDIWLGVLDEALPPSITPLALMPSQWASHLQTRIPVAAMNQASAMGSGELISPEQTVQGWFRHGCAYRTTEISPVLAFHPLRTGDSGYPIVTIVGNDLVLLGHLTLESGMNFLGPDYSFYADDIQKAISSLGTNSVAKAERIHRADLGRFR